MQHRKTGRKLGRVRKQRTALLRGLARSLILHEKIKTTEAKAKELRPFVEKLITKSKLDSVSSRRLIDSRLGGEDEAVKKLFETLAPRYKERSGGYTRITKLSSKSDDARQVAQIEFV